MIENQRNSRYALPIMSDIIRYYGRSLASRLERLKISIDTLAFLSGESVETLNHLTKTGGEPPSGPPPILCLLATAGPERRAYVERLAAEDRGGARVEWRSIPQFPDYEASTMGKIRRVSGSGRAWVGRALKEKTTRTGHKNVTVVSPGGRQVMIGVHRLVSMAFHGAPPDDKPMSLHRNGVADDNRPENLYWGDHLENVADRIRHVREARPPASAPRTPAATQTRHKKYETKMVRGVEKRILR